MIPYETDPTLHDHEPAPAQLDDGFSPRPQPEPAAPRGHGDTASEPSGADAQAS